MPDLAAIQKAVEEMQKANERCYEDLKYVFTEGLRGIRIENNSSQFVINESIKNLDKTIKEHNGRLYEVETRLDKREIKSDEAIKEFHGYVGKIKWVKKNWYWLGLLLIFVIGFVVILFRIEAIDKAVLWLIGKT